MIIRNLAIIGLLLTATPVLAQEPPPPPPCDCGAAGRHHFDRRVAAIEARLMPTTAQKPLWDALVQVIKTNMRNRVEHFRAMREAGPKDAPAHLDDRLAILTEEIHGVEREKAALTALWATLDAAQRETLSKAIAWHPRHGKPGHPDRDSAE